MSSRRADRKAMLRALDLNPSHRRLLYIFTWLSGLIAIQIMHLALDDLKLNIGLTGALTAGFVYAYYLEDRWRSLTTYAVSALAVAVSLFYFLGVYRDIMRLGTYLGILAGVLIVLLSFKAFQVSDHRFILMFSVVFLLYSSVASYDLKFMLLLPLFLTCAGCALYLANQVDVAARVAETSKELKQQRLQVKFRIGLDFAWVLVRAVGGVILLSTLAYLFTPHTGSDRRSNLFNPAPSVDQPAGTFNEVERPNSPVTSPVESNEIGLGEDFDLSGSGELTADPRRVLELRSHRNGYLRAAVYDVYTGSGWIKAPFRFTETPDQIEHPFAGTEKKAYTYPVTLYDFPSESLSGELRKSKISVADSNVYSTQDLHTGYESIRQEIRLLDNQPAIYFSMFQPYRLENISLNPANQPINLPVQNDASIVIGNDLGSYHPKGFNYTVWSIALQPSRTDLLNVFSEAPSLIQRNYLQYPFNDDNLAEHCSKWRIPEQACRPVTKEFQNFARFEVEQRTSKKYRAGKVPTFAKVEAIADYLSVENGFTYSRSYIPQDTNKEISEAFCLSPDGKQGYCRQFASTMALMCRINGIPSRVVTGYAPGDYSLIDNAYIVKASNAHAWVEFYLDGYGWLMFDPTPEGIGAGDAGRHQVIAEIISFLQKLFVLDPAGIQQQMISALAFAWQWILAHWLTSLCACGILVACVLGVRWLLRQRLRCDPGKIIPENHVIECYLGSLTVLCQLDLKHRPSESARSFAVRAVLAFSDLSEPLGDLVPAYERAAFAPGQLQPADVATAKSALLKVRLFVTAEIARRKQKK